MARIVVLGASGGIGSMAAATLARSDTFAELVLADVVTPEQLADELGRVHAGVAAARVDADDPGALAAVLAGADMVLNCVGPFYRFGPPILRAAITAGVDYVDVCDDLAPTRTMLALDGEASRRGVTALIGMGNSPGLANVLVRYCADHLLDRVDTVDIMHIHGGEPTEGPAVVKHRIHAMTNDVPVWHDGELITVRMLADSGAPYIVDVDFRNVGRYPVYPYPHPETITLPRYLPGVRRVTNRGVVFPLSYFDLIRQMVVAGTCTTDPLEVAGAPVVPIDFAVAHVLARRPALLSAAGVNGPAGCLRIDVAGEKDGAQHLYVFSLSSDRAGAAEGTGIPAALGAMLLLGAEPRPGVHPPEALIDPVALLELAGTVMHHIDVGAPGGGVPIHVEHHAPDGSVSEVALAL